MTLHRTKAACWGAGAAFITTDINVDSITTNPSGQFESKDPSHLQTEQVQPILKEVPIIEPEPIYLLDFPIGSPEYALLKSKFSHPKAAMLVQHLEFLNRQYGVPFKGIYRNIRPCGDMNAKQTISGHIGISSDRILGPILNEVRVSRTFKRGVHLNPSEIDFQGKLYAAFYLPSHKQRTVYWFRNKKLINQLYAEIKSDLVKQKQADKLKYVVPREPLGESASDGASEVSSEVSYICKEVEKRKKESDKDKDKSSNSLKLVPSVSVGSENVKSEAVGKVKTEKQNNLIDKDDKSKLSTKAKITTQLGRGVYPLYKKYCETSEKGLLMSNLPSPLVARRLGKMVEAFNEFELTETDIEQFFMLLAENHADVSYYLKKHNVWQVKDHVYFIGEDLLEIHSNLFATWYKQRSSNAVTKSAIATDYANSLVKNKLPNKINKPKNGPNISREGFTYHPKWNRPPEQQESSEYGYACSYKREMDDEDPDNTFSYIEMCVIKEYSVNLDASLKRIAYLQTLSREELDELPMPR
jgi:hypothetical protein